MKKSDNMAWSLHRHLQITESNTETTTASELLPENLRNLLVTLHREFEQEREELLAARRIRQYSYDLGATPKYLDDHPAQFLDWNVAPIPADLMDRRVEITGPVNSAKMVIQMLNPTADGAVADMAMLDFEDSMRPLWQNVLDGIRNVIGAVSGTLTYRQISADGEKTYELVKGRKAHPMVRVRGLHLDESHVEVDGEPISAGLFDLVVTAYHAAPLYLQKGLTPKYYVPKTEHYLEARWWNRLFSRVEESLKLKPGEIRCTLLIETLPAAFQMEEILYEIREHACGLNGGRWDKIFSDIKTLKNHPDRILADRSYIDMTRPWMENYVKRLVKICHKHGAFAMGGMSAFTPGRDPETRRIQTEKVLSDKKREASIGHDGCWVSHPYFVPIAREAFTRPNQLDFQLDEFPARPNLLPLSVGPRTLHALRSNIRVGIAYKYGWNQGLGCVAFENLMEDLATLEISRAQVWQWLHHRVILQDGIQVTPELVSKLFPEECEKVIQAFLLERGPLPSRSELEKIRSDHLAACKEVQKLFLEEHLPEFFTTYEASLESLTQNPHQGGDYHAQL